MVLDAASESLAVSSHQTVELGSVGLLLEVMNDSQLTHQVAEDEMITEKFLFRVRQLDDGGQVAIGEEGMRGVIALVDDPQDVPDSSHLQPVVDPPE